MTILESDSLLEAIHAEGLSVFQWLVREGKARQYIASLPVEQREAFAFHWPTFRRPAQIPPRGDWRIWLILAGRGFGKTRTGAEWVREQVAIGNASRIALVGRTAADVRDTMIEGESGILACTPKAERPTYIGSKRRVVWPNGAYATAYSAEEPDRLRGPNHDLAWADELAAWRYSIAWDQLMFGLRIGLDPRVVVTTTPRPTHLMKTLASRNDVIVTKGSTFDNAGNLSPSFLAEMTARYGDTRLGMQELYAEFLDDTEGALWTQATIDASRMAMFNANEPWRSLNEWLVAGGMPPKSDRRAWRIVVAVDPPGETAECGIVVAAAPTQGHAGVDHVVILEDASIAGRPEMWGQQVASTARKWNAERVVVEANQGGDMTRATIAAVDPTLRIEKIHAKVSKAARAEPVSALYERGLVHHAGFLPMLESQMTTWITGDKSPDRLDALVHAVSSLVTAQAKVQASVRSVANRRLPA
jgi:phage terminase large subunit-like protein